MTFKESDHPRDPAGSSTGGRFAGGVLDAITKDARHAAGLRQHEMGSSLFKELHAKQGFSESVHGKNPPSGYMTATSDETENVYPVETITARDIAKYAVKHWKQLQEPNTYLGGWLDTDEKTGITSAYLDVSTNYQSMAETIRVAQGANQIGIFDVKNFRTIYVYDPSGRLYTLDDHKIKHWME